MNTETTAQTFEIPAVNFPVFEAKFATLAKRAARLGSDPIAFEVVRTFLRKITPVDPDTGRRGEPFMRLYHEVRVSGPRPKLAGWEFCGRLDFKAAAPGVLRMMVPGESCPDVATDATPERCDHCHQARRRNDSFIVRHDDGRTLVVGRSCLADFLGHESPEHIASLCTLLADLRACSEDAEREGYGRGGEDCWEPALTLALTSYSIRTTGWAPSASDTSTKSDVGSLLTPCREDRDESARRARLAEVSDEDHAHAVAALEWILALDTAGNDYLHNLKTICGAAVTYKTLGIAVSGICAYDRAMEREIATKRAAERKGESRHVGHAKDRITFDGEIVMIRYCDGSYGTTTIVKLVDDAGNVFTWFASGSLDLKRGGRYAVKGTVKKHDSYQGQAQTVLTRCKLEALT